MSGCTLGNLSVYKKFDYMIQIDAPFKEREDRVFSRDILLKKGIMVRRDVVFRDSLKKGENRNYIDEKISNTGDLQELQKIADEIYSKKIDNTYSRPKTIREKYGGYKTRPIDMNKISSRRKAIGKSNKTR